MQHPAVWLDEQGIKQQTAASADAKRQFVDAEDFLHLHDTPHTNGAIQEANYYEYEAPGNLDSRCLIAL